MVHVGVSGKSSALTLEQQAFNSGYVQLDIAGCVPDGNVCSTGCKDVLTSGLDMNLICQTINNSSCGVASTVSYDPGHYLCGFTFYNSMCINRKCTAFIHVPDLDQPYSALQLAEGLKVAITAMLEQIRETEKEAIWWFNVFQVILKILIFASVVIIICY